MYLQHYGLKRLPFRITPDTRSFYTGSDRGASLQALCFAIARGEGIVKVVGEVGTGKTMLCRMLTVALKRPIDWVYLAHPSLSPEHTLHTIAYELGIKVSETDDKLSVMRKLQKTLLHRHAQGRQVVILIEEAQGMPLDTLEEIRLLSNLETDRYKLLQIVLFGQPELNHKLKNNSIRQLRERITFGIELRPLNAEEVVQYLNFRVRAAGYRGPNLFDFKTAKLIHKYSNGLVRRINILADKVLLTAFTGNRHSIEIDDVHYAAIDSGYKQRRFWQLKVQAASISVGLLITGYISWQVMTGVSHALLGGNV